MTLPGDILQVTVNLPDRERAAALAHAVYVETTREMSSDWSMRVPDSWDELDHAAREFNLASIDMWAQMPEALEAWVAAVKASRYQGRSGI